MRLRRMTVAALGTGVVLALLPGSLALADDPSGSPSLVTPSAPTSIFDPTASTSPWPSPVATPIFAAPAPARPVATAAETPAAPPAKPAMRMPRAKLPLKKTHYGSKVAKAQQRLVWLGYDVSDTNLQYKAFGDSTVRAVKAFQTKFWLKPTGVIDKRTWKELSKKSSPLDVLPSACTSVKVSLCADKTTRLIRYVVKGKVKLTLDARFGLPGMETGEGTFSVKEKSRNHVSTLYHTWMPFAMFFNGDEAVHYSPYFEHDGYNGGSHGCIGVRDIKAAEWLFDRIPVGTRVYVYWSP